MTFRGWALTLLLLLPQEPQEPVAPPPELPPCMTCDGQGKTLLDCGACNGGRTGPCVACTFPVVQLEHDLDIELVGLLRTQDLDRANEIWERIYAAGQRLFPQEKYAAGTLACPATCDDGKTRISRRFDCSACKAKGSIPCGECRGRGTGKCWSCTGERRWVQQCPECTGTGRSPGIAARTSDNLGSCPWCTNVRLRDCRGCPENGSELRTCEGCVGTGEVQCEVCAGTAKKPCEPCWASGDLSAPHGLHGRSGRCDTCSAKGVLTCDGCSRGRAQCGGCDGSGKAEQPCRSCRGRKQLPCSGCVGWSSRAWLVTADRLIANGSRELGIAHIEQAIERETKRIDSELNWLKISASEREKLRRDLDREHIAPLRKRLTAAQKE